MSVSIPPSLPKSSKGVKEIHMMINQFATVSWMLKKIHHSLDLETKDFITHSNSSSQRINVALIFQAPSPTGWLEEGQVIQASGCVRGRNLRLGNMCSGGRHYLCHPRLFSFQTSLERQSVTKEAVFLLGRCAEMWDSHGNCSPRQIDQERLLEQFVILWKHKPDPTLITTGHTWGLTFLDLGSVSDIIFLNSNTLTCLQVLDKVLSYLDIADAGLIGTRLPLSLHLDLYSNMYCYQSKSMFISLFL